MFVFTLGLTETWCSREDGTAFPLVPGAGIGTFDDARYAFRNLTVAENERNLEEFLAIAWSLNPALRVILTVSPVPLAATMEPRHVVQANTYSKAVLRVAAEAVRERYEQVEYFASYEIVAGGYDGGDNYATDRREVTGAAVDRVMRSFFHAFAPADGAPNVVPFSLDTIAQNNRRLSAANDPCDESFLAGIITTC